MGVAAIAKAMDTNQNVTWLDLNHCRITSVTALAEMLGKNRVLEKLGLCTSEFTDVDGDALRVALAKHPCCEVFSYVNFELNWYGTSAATSISRCSP